METVAKKIMIVDDDHDFLKELEATLQLGGYDVVAVNDPFKAVAVAKRAKPLIIFLDLKMPGKSGFQIADELRRISEFEEIPIVAMTAWFKGKPNPLLDVCGFSSCLIKPFYPLNLIDCIESTLKNSVKSIL